MHYDVFNFYHYPKNITILVKKILHNFILYITYTDRDNIILI